MTPTLVPGRPGWVGGPAAQADADAGRARDWAEIQERMLVPLYEAVYERLAVGTHTRLLALGCGTGLALLLAAARGAAVTGVDHDERRLALARDRLPAHPAVRLAQGGAGAAADPAAPAFTVVTAFDPFAPAAGRGAELTAAARLARRGAAVVVAGWGPPERCATAGVLGPAAEVAGRDDLEGLCRAAGLRPDGGGRVRCPFGYADLDSAVRGLIATGVFDAAIAAADRVQTEKELTEALHPYRAGDGTVRMENVLRYVIART
ncbi:methyltransferase domain-containing protein [Streptomyces sp. ICBB 8177]|uniref:methyltransferase domain-containing protein n=1 Tax=Streptomyces sp. ICBB 8177 TaxID=563922 RepID=UPI000D67D0DE|nr:methyltransferase domain-containing protein [Streptomyces sp. ICBB 8177]PWI44297.1 SAM-dependent methyltransferase [Streptomyces sp. ICBB 8177]